MQVTGFEDTVDEDVVLPDDPAIELLIIDIDAENVTCCALEYWPLWFLFSKKV